MARINRTDVIQKAVNDLALSTSTDKIPTETLDKVQLTFDLNRNISNFVVSGGSTTTGSVTATLPSVSAGADTYITALNYSLVKDATCDTATSNLLISVTPDASGISTTIHRIPTITLTAQTFDGRIVLPYPLKVKNASTITMTGSFTIGVQVKSVGVVGFTTTSN